MDGANVISNNCSYLTNTIDSQLKVSWFQIQWISVIGIVCINLCFCNGWIIYLQFAVIGKLWYLIELLIIIGGWWRSGLIWNNNLIWIRLANYNLFKWINWDRWIVLYLLFINSDWPLFANWQLIAHKYDHFDIYITMRHNYAIMSHIYTIISHI